MEPCISEYGVMGMDDQRGSLFGSPIHIGALYIFKEDVYGFGVILLELVTGKLVKGCVSVDINKELSLGHVKFDQFKRQQSGSGNADEAVRELPCEILELIAEGLGVPDTWIFSRFIRDVDRKCSREMQQRKCKHSSSLTSFLSPLAPGCIAE
ncbi:hypothetical protein JHK85_009905 [Glycine max]|nr:hypothetical protein JHK85_009905 [Glycine max]KAG5065916.1 hypothetical protein JHK86_009647 [Glycine max]